MKLQTIHSLDGHRGLGHPESACACYRANYNPRKARRPARSCRFDKAKGHWVCKPKRRKRRRM